jgi:hypothetical protein
MDLRAEERVNRGNKRVLSEIDVSEWEITCTETCPHKGKRRCNPSKATQLPVGKTPSRATKLKRKKRRGRGSALSRKPSNKSLSPETLHPVCATIVDNPGITQRSARTPDSRTPSNRSRTPDSLLTTTATSQAFKWSKAN